MNPTLPPQQQRPPNQHRPQQQQGPPKLQLAKIADMKPNLNDINVICIVLERKESAKTKEHTIHTFLVADETAAMNLTLWGEKAEGLIPGDIIRITGGRCSIWKNYLSLYTGKKGGIERVGDFNLAFNEAKNMSVVEYFEDPAGSKNFVARPRQAQSQHVA